MKPKTYADPPDPHFGTDEQMLAWCERENINPVKDEDGQWDWHAAWEEYLNRPDPEDATSSES